MRHTCVTAASSIHRIACNRGVPFTASDEPIVAHAVEVETISDGVRAAVKALGGAYVGRYRWRCSCRRTGMWCSRVRSARNGGARHVAAMEKR